MTNQEALERIVNVENQLAYEINRAIQLGWTVTQMELEYALKDANEIREHFEEIEEMMERV